MSLLIFFFYGIPFDLVFCTIEYCVGAGVSTLIAISDGLDAYFFRQKMEKTRSMREEKDEKVFVFSQIWYFSNVNFIIKVLFLIFTLTWRGSNYISKEKSLYRRNKITS